MVVVVVSVVNAAKSEEDRSSRKSAATEPSLAMLHTSRPTLLEDAPTLPPPMM
jgi:hypothetical protein